MHNVARACDLDRHATLCMDAMQNVARRSETAADATLCMLRAGSTR
jgi:hypothetical protein